MRQWFAPKIRLLAAVSLALLTAMALFMGQLPASHPMWVSLRMLNPVQNLAHAFERLELGLLDQRIRLRSHFLKPNPDIMLVVFDTRAQDYGDKNPELGIASGRLPRDQVGRIIRYLQEQGARAVITDVEFSDDRPTEDPGLIEALQAKRNVYIAAFLDKSFREFVEQDVNGLAWKRGELEQFYTYQLLRSHLWDPLFRAQLIPFSRLVDGRFDAVLFSRMGVGPFFDVGMYGDSLFADWQAQGFRSRALGTELPLLRPFPARTFAATSEPWTNFLGQACMQAFTQRRFSQEPAYLQLLRRKAVPVELLTPPTLEDEQALTYCRTSRVVPDVLTQAAGLGMTSIAYDEDGHTRYINPLFRGYEGHFYPLLTVRPALDFLGNPTIKYDREAYYFGDKRIDLIDGRRVLINWRSPRTVLEDQIRRAGGNPEDPVWADRLRDIRTDEANVHLGYGHLYRFVSAADLLKKMSGKPYKPEEMPSLYNLYGDPSSGEYSFKGKYIVYGNVVKDIHRTPMGDTTAGPELMATVLDMFLNPDEMFVQASAPWLNILVVLAFTAGIMLVVTRFQRLYLGFLAGVCILFGYGFYNFLIFIYLGVWMPLVWPSVVTSLALLGAIIFRYYVQDQEKRQLTTVFSKYVSPQVMNEILLNPSSAMNNLRGSKKNLTVLFSDIHNFTHQFENEDPENIVSQLNEYFDAMTRVVLKHGGTYDKYMGDALMAFFGAPIDMEDHAEKACQAALEMQVALQALNRKWESEGKTPLKHGVGVSTGPMFVGNFGSEEIKNFTVIGSTVNLGARLEMLTRTFNVDTVISDTTYNYIRHWASVKDLGEVPVKGFSQPVRIYGLLGDKTAPKTIPLPEASPPPEANAAS